MVWPEDLKRVVAYKIYQYREEAGLSDGHTPDTDYDDAERFLRVWGDEWLKSKENIDGLLNTWLDGMYTDKFNNHNTQVEDYP